MIAPLVRPLPSAIYTPKPRVAPAIERARDRGICPGYDREEARLNALAAQHSSSGLPNHALKLGAQALFGLRHGGGRWSKNFFPRMRAIAIGS
jgi:hypothetical protein